MKPILLKIAGLHSYREQVEIDFETLCAAGLFGIFGPTGSGKSTILDAITLALYGQVVRAGGTSHPATSLNQHEQRLYVSFTFELGSEHARKRYTIEREFGLDKKGNRRQPEVRLIERASDAVGEDTVLESRHGSATQAVEQLLGLTLHDFTRAVVLPQGQFSRFLTLKGSERNEMLQRIFHLHEYGEKLNERIHATTERNKEELHRLEKALAGLGDAGPEALQRADTELQQAMEQEQSFRQQQGQLQEQKTALEQVRAWSMELQEIEALLLQVAKQRDEVNDLEARCQAIEASIRVWPQMEKVTVLEAEHESLTQRLAQLRLDREAAEQAYIAAEQRYQTAQDAWKQEEPLLIDQKHKLQQALEWEHELHSLEVEVNRSETTLRTLHEELGRQVAEQRQLQEQMTAWEQSRNKQDEELRATAVSPEERKTILELRERKLAWEQEQARLRQWEQEAAVARLEWQKQAERVAEQHKQWQQAIASREQAAARLQELESQPMIGEQEISEKQLRLQQVKTLGKEWRDWTRDREDWERRRAEWADLQRASQEALARCEAHQKQAENVLLPRKQMLAEREDELLRWRQANMAKVLRDHLRPGEACPVCGSADHTAEKASGTDHHLDEQQGRLLQEQCKHAEAACAEAEKEWREAEKLFHAEQVKEAALQQRRAMLDDEQAALEGRIARIQQECRQWGPEWAVSDLDSLVKVYQTEEQALRKRMDEREQHRSQLEAWGKQLQIERDQEWKQQGLYEKEQAIYEQMKGSLEAAEHRTAESVKAAAEAQQALDERRNGLTLEAIEENVRLLAEREEREAVIRRERAELEERLNAARQGLENVQKRSTETERQAAVIRERVEQQKQLVLEKKESWLERTQGLPARECLQRLELQLSSLKEASEVAECGFAAEQEKRQRLQEAYVQTEAAWEQVTRQRGAEEAMLQRMLKEGQLPDTATAGRLFAEREALASYREQVQSYHARHAQLSFDAERLKGKLAGRSVTDEEYEQIREAYEQMEMMLQASRDQVAVARQTLTSIQSHHQQWLECTSHLQELQDEQSRLDELKRLFEGKAFVQFIAEEKLASIARDASYHLMQMTRNRYGLELGDGGEFVLRDEGAGGVRRAVSTLSGGETFLTSLALALALSVEIQMRGAKLEFFFLDEGFGTLDPELLEIVLNALERLRMNDLTIGIISHVPELRERMPRRLIVTPPEPLGAGSRVLLETE